MFRLNLPWTREFPDILGVKLLQYVVFLILFIIRNNKVTDYIILDPLEWFTLCKVGSIT